MNKKEIESKKLNLLVNKAFWEGVIDGVLFSILFYLAFIVE